jgi:hypothetical protein
MHMRALAGAIVCATAARSAGAQCTQPIVSPCIDSDTLWPHAGPSQFLTVGGTETTAAERISFGLVTTYLLRPIRIATPSPGPSGSNADAIGDQLDATFLFAYGVTDRLELDLALPVTVFQDGAGTGPIDGSGSIAASATRDMRLGLTYAFVRRPRKHPWRHDTSGFGLAGRFEMSAPTGDANAFASEPTAVFVPSVAADYRSHRFFMGAEVGVRIRPVTDFLGSRIGTQGVIAAGVGFDILQNELLTLTGEVRFLPVFTEQANATRSVSGYQSEANGQYIVPAEWMATLRTSPIEGGDLTFQLGAGGALPGGTDGSGNIIVPITVPAFRIALGLTFAPRGRDTDSDGVPDAIDHCPLEPGPKDSATGTGCPP